jgi:hypothetical protein
MPAAWPVRRRSGACSGDVWELHLANTQRRSGDVALRNPTLPFFLCVFLARIVFWQKSWVYRVLMLYQQKSLSPRMKKCRRARWIEQESIVAPY